MSLIWRGACALTLAACFSGYAAAEAADGEAITASFDLDQVGLEQVGTPGDIELASCDVCADACGSCSTCVDGGCGAGGLDLGLGGTPMGQFFVGAEYLAVRANFSEATAYRINDTGAPSETFEQFGFDYGNSYRLYGGFRLCECGGELRFSYTSFSSEGSAGPDTFDNANGRIISPNFDVPVFDGDTVVGDASVDVDDFDIGFSKTIPLGCLSACDPCGCGTEACGCGPVCPAWDIVWSGGVRFASVDSVLNVRNTAGGPGSSAFSVLNFDGAGLRFGLLGRRYFGRSGLVSAYVNGNVSLLLGEVDYGIFRQPGTTPVEIRSTQVVPVTEIEAGLTAFLTRNVSLSGGYLLSAWHDLGHRAEYDALASGSPVLSMDDANLMTFDGLFLRAEAVF